jgi:predicted DCC family thiol-disulfide oxidoreductase YuxK
MTLLYDADCGFCTASAAWLRRRRLRTAIEPLQRADLAGLGVDAERARRQIPFVERDEAGTRVSYGHVAVGRALATGGRGWRLAGWLLRHPPVSWPARAGYALVARHRHLLPGSTAACRIDGAPG